MNVRKWLAAGLTIAAVAVIVTTPAAAAPTLPPVLVRWDFNEKSPTHPGTGPAPIVARSGTEVVNTGSVILMPYVADWKTALHPQRLTLATDSRLNPGTSDYAVTVRFRTTHNFGNILQKGQANTPGGYWKWEIPSGKLACRFMGTSGDITVNSGTHLLNDGAFHRITCSRVGTRITMSEADNTTGAVLWSRTGDKVTGSISNDFDLTIGGKGKCDNGVGQPNHVIKVSCDYFPGDIDLVEIRKGA